LLTIEECRGYLKDLNLTDEEIIKCRDFFVYIANRVIDHVEEQKHSKRF
jgi:hypothetical protein